MRNNLTAAEEFEVDNEPFDNGEGWLYVCGYHVWLADIQTTPFYINAENGESAIDEAVDVAEERGQAGLYVSHDEMDRTDDPNAPASYDGEELWIVGNHSLGVFGDQVRTKRVKTHPKYRKG